MSDDDINALRTRMIDAVVKLEGLCAYEKAQAIGDADRAARLHGALRHMQRGLATTASILARRRGEPQFRPARVVVDLASALAAQKAIARLLGLLDDEHHAVHAWLTADGDAAEDEAMARLEEAHRRVREAVEAVAA